MKTKLIMTGLCAAALASGCTSMDELPAGTPYKTVQAQYGEPTMTCPLPNGGFRAIWSQQPLGEYAWGTNVDSKGNVDVIVQLLDDKIFNEKLAEGTWDPEKLKCAFGPPATIDDVGLPSVRKHVWSYRDLQYGVWYMMMNVFFDPKTMIMTGHYPTPDPMFDDDDVWVW